ncbi:MAG: N-acetylmuramoyl-L-alanine amidase [Nitrospirota bacterium]|nr:MAG: N-acetylmuramoyl-L-alanine amidase [Nitrospirota bacterium]
MILGSINGSGARRRRAILKGVYEENLVMLGRRPRSSGYRKMGVLMKSSVVLFSMVFFLLIGRFDSSELANVGAVSPEIPPQVTSSFSPQRLMQVSDSGQDLSYYRSLFADSMQPIWNIFGFKVRTIIIDPGHGGDDPGAIGKMGTEEKDITLDIAKRLRDKLTRFKNYQILMTRENDVTVPLNDRIEFANKHNADLYISIHVNYVPRKPINIIETYYFGAYSDEETLKLAEKENEGTEYTLSAYRNVVMKIGDTMKFQESKQLATFIQESLYGNISKSNKEILDYGIKTAPFVVLLGVDVPSVLTEISCLSNESEEMKLNAELYREEIANYLEEGVVKYLNKNFNKGETHYAAR